MPLREVLLRLRPFEDFQASREHTQRATLPLGCNDFLLLGIAVKLGRAIDEIAINADVLDDTNRHIATRPASVHIQENWIFAVLLQIDTLGQYPCAVTV